MARVLVLTREPPFPPDAGDRIVTHGILQALTHRGHEAHVLTYADGDVPSGLEETCASLATVAPPAGSSLPPTLRKLARALRGRSDVMSMFQSTAFAEATADRILALDPDVVLAEHPYMGQVLRRQAVASALDESGASWVTNAHVVEHAAHRRQARQSDDPVERLLLSIESSRLEREELAVYEASDGVLVLGEGDRERLPSRAGPVHVQRVPLDVDAYPPVGRKRAEEPAVLFFGSYDWFPNEHGVHRLVEEIWPRVQARVPEAQLWLAGRQAPTSVEALAGRTGVRFLGEVDDLAAWVERASLVVAPIWVGGGVRIKVLEAMAWASPVVATETAAEGVRAKRGEALRVAEEPAGFAEVVSELLSDEKQRRRLGDEARATVAERYELEAVSRELEANLGL